MNFTTTAQNSIRDAIFIAKQMRHDFVTPEHWVMALLMQSEFIDCLRHVNINPALLKSDLKLQLLECTKLVGETDLDPSPSHNLNELLGSAAENAIASDTESVTVPHMVKALLEMEECYAGYYLGKQITSNRHYATLLSTLYRAYAQADGNPVDTAHDPGAEADIPPGAEFDVQENEDETEYNSFGEPQVSWKKLVACMNDHLEGRNPLIGREDEIERTIRILCRKDKNNVLHIGEPGVGKTALIYGLAQRINAGNVPDKLKGARIFMLDLGALVAGTQYRGDFENRINAIMKGVSKEKMPIIYIDEIHNLVGAGAVGNSSLDASNMLKPYLEAGKIRFIGSTTFDEYKRHFEKSRGIVRRFQQMDITEPTVDEAIAIIGQLRDVYETFHHVRYTGEALEYSVRGSARHIQNRCLPDKAIDLIDEAGAYRQLHPEGEGEQTVDKTLIETILSKMCKIEKLAEGDRGVGELSTLSERMLGKIFGQDRAVEQTTEAVLIAKAGIEEENKPLASLLFVGPTGVGKTEVSKVLAEELGVPFVRFDMSEYAEKHTVAKLIGSPAGYVGYEDGGLLTDAIRKNPECVLLLDEIEKAHEDIYNILLQVMDYASLTDNRGNKADFRNVILIMTSNAGAQHASKANVGFASRVSKGDAMMAQVKRTFKPEFLNRLSGTVVFRDMDSDMAGRILDKKLSQLETRLRNRNVKLELSASAREHLLKTAITQEYGAREIDRVLTHTLKPLLMRAILFGKLKNGGTAHIDYKEDGLLIE